MARIAHFNTYPHGGAATAALRLHRQLRADGNDSLVYWSHCDHAEPVEPGLNRLPLVSSTRGGLGAALTRPLVRQRQRTISSSWDSQIARRDQSAEVFSMAEQYEPLVPDWRLINADVVHLHWIAFMADWPAFFGAIPDQVPLVWTLHDQNPFTGGCHYSDGCERFTAGCGHCPQLVGGGATDISRRSLLVKQQALRRKRMHVISPSRWMDGLARQSPVWPARTTFSVVHYGLPLNQFFPREKAAARRALGIGEHETVLGFGADNIANPRKGFSLLAAALRSVADQQPKPDGLTGLLVGGGSSQGPPVELPGLTRTMHLGFLPGPEKIANFYSACDFVVVPSLEDNHPQMALEAMACGRPVIAFDTGGIGEFVLDGITGRLVPLRDVESLATAIRQLAEAPALRDNLGQRARMLIQRDFEAASQTARVTAIYDHFLSSTRRRAA